MVMMIGNVITIGTIAFLLSGLKVASAAQIGKREVKTGGIQPVDEGEAAVWPAAEFAVTRYNMGSNSIYQYSLLSITSATYQVDAGVRYEILLTIECKNEGACPQPSDDDAEKSCTASVLHQEWSVSAPFQLLGITCQ